MIQIRNLSKTYRSNTGMEQIVLQNLNLVLEEGSSLAIIGPSGSGKSTLLNLIGALDKPDSGSIEVKSKSVQNLSKQELYHYRNQQVGFIFQMHHLLPQLNVLDNVLLPVMAFSKVDEEKKNIALELIESVGLSEKLYQFPSQLSGGECQRVAVVRALINQPEILLADEPTGSLDEENAASVAELLIQLCKKTGTTLIVVTHSVELAKKLDKQMVLNHGKIENGHA